MAHKLSDIITLARDQLQDTRTPYRHSDAKLIRYLNLALSDALRLRPDLFFPDASDKDYAYTVADIEATLPVDFAYRIAIVFYVVGMTSLEDDEFVANGRGAALLSQFKQKLTGTP